jgi:hypothetical protein
MKDWQRKYSENTGPNAALSNSKPTWLDSRSNPDHRGGKPATNYLSYDTATFTNWLELYQPRVSSYGVKIGLIYYLEGILASVFSRVGECWLDLSGFRQGPVSGPSGHGNERSVAIARQLNHTWRRGCQPRAPAALYSPETFLFISLLEPK